MQVTVTSHKIEIEKAAEEAIERALEAIGIHCESHAKANLTAADRRDTGNLINSVTHQVDESEKAVYVGSNLEYAIYNEVGTGIYTDGGGGRKDPWSYQDAEGNWHRTSGMKPVHFLKNAAADHVDEYKRIVEEQLKSG